MFVMNATTGTLHNGSNPCYSMHTVKTAQGLFGCSSDQMDIAETVWVPHRLEGCDPSWTHAPELFSMPHRLWKHGPWIR